MTWLGGEVERCDNCGHSWHGLACNKKVLTYNGYRAEESECNCPSQFVDRTLDTDLSD